MELAIVGGVSIGYVLLIAPPTDIGRPQMGKFGRRLRKARSWLAGKGETFADEFTKAFAKSLGTSAGVAVAAGSLIAVFQGFLRALVQ